MAGGHGAKGKTLGQRFEALYVYFRQKIILQFALEIFFVALAWSFFLFQWMPAHPEAASLTGAFLFFILPFVLPCFLAIMFYDAWFEYWRTKKYAETEHCLLEIRLPEEITQSPYAMELVLRGIYQTGETDTPVHVLWGNTKPWFSLEIVSTEGRVRFYTWMRKRYKGLFEAQIYAHYPTVQVVEVPDYTLQMPFDPAAVDVWGIEQALQKPDPWPIVTYEEIGLTNKGPDKEELKHDPLASMLEYFGSIGEGEHLWSQIIIRAHTGPQANCPYATDYHIHHQISVDKWAKIEIDKITDSAKNPKTGEVNFLAITATDREYMEAIQKKLNKQLFDTGIRSMYVSRKDKTNSGPRIGIASAFRSFEHGSEGRGLNGLKPIFWIGPFNFRWHDIMGIRRRMLMRRFYDAYVTRQFFYEPHKHRHIVLNTAELATIYHFPGQVVQTPTLERLPSKRAQAPTNLPV